MGDTFKALSSPVRREILDQLKARDMTAGDISDGLSATGTVVSKPTLSGHFNVLREADLIHADKVGTTITYSLNTSVVEDMMTHLMGLLGQKQEDKSEKNNV